MEKSGLVDMLHVSRADSILVLFLRLVFPPRRKQVLFFYCQCQEHRQETIAVYMTYVRGGAGPILLLSVCQCQKHTTDTCFCLYDPCFHGGLVRF